MENYFPQRTHRITPGVLHELKSLALGLADLCQRQKPTIEEIQDKAVNGKVCRGCKDIFTGIPHKARYSNGPFCSTPCATGYDDWYMEIASESQN